MVLGFYFEGQAGDWQELSGDAQPHNTDNVVTCMVGAKAKPEHTPSPAADTRSSDVVSGVALTDEGQPGAVDLNLQQPILVFPYATDEQAKYVKSFAPSQSFHPSSLFLCYLGRDNASKPCVKTVAEVIP